MIMIFIDVWFYVAISLDNSYYPIEQDDKVTHMLIHIYSYVYHAKWNYPNCMRG